VTLRLRPSPERQEQAERRHPPPPPTPDKLLILVGVVSTMTVRPELERSSATKLWIQGALLGSARRGSVAADLQSTMDDPHRAWGARGRVRQSQTEWPRLRAQRVQGKWMAAGRGRCAWVCFEGPIRVRSMWYFLGQSSPVLD